MKPSAADRRSPTRWDGAVILSVLILAASLFLLIYPHSGQGADLVTIQQGGHVTGTFYLSTLKEPLSVTVKVYWPGEAVPLPRGTRMSPQLVAAVAKELITMAGLLS